MSVSAGGIIGIIFGILVALAILFGILLVFFKFWMRGPTKGSDNRKKLDGRVVVVTGATAGIGKSTALDLSKRGARIIILARDINRGEKAAKEIRDETGGKVDIEKLDLASLRSVRNCAQRLIENEDKIDILINNAGVLSTTRGLTEDGYEMHFGTNHLGHFLFTELVKPLLMKSSASGFHPRIVIVSALAHTHTRMNWEDLNSERNFFGWRAYAQSKLANILHAKELANRLENTGISVYVLHPGVIATELARNLQSYWFLRMTKPIFNFVAKTPFYGAQTTLYCALDDAIECESGMYYSDCARKNPSNEALNKEDQKRLWDISEEMVGIKSSK